MKFKKLFQSKVFRTITLSVAGLIVLLLVFRAGMIVGYKKANFSYRWGENYHRNFGGPRSGFFKEFFDKEFIDGHGIFGEIVKIDGSTLVVKGRDNVEKIVLAGTAVINRNRDTIAIGELKVGDYIVTIGTANESGQIEAKLIRFMPSPFTSRR